MEPDDALCAARAGPSPFHDVVNWAHRHLFIQHDAAPGENFVNALGENLRKGVVVSACYSGNGTAEFAAAEFCRAFSAVADASGPTVQARMYSVCDWDVAARKVFLPHGAQTAPEHVFNNIVDRVGEKSMASLEAALKLLQIQVESQLDEAHSQVRPAEHSHGSLGEDGGDRPCDA